MSDAFDETVYLTFIYEGATMRAVDTVIVEGEPWLVLSWIGGLPGGGRRPARLVGPPAGWFLPALGLGAARWSIPRPLPKAALEGRAPFGPDTEIRVRAAPNHLRWPLPEE